MFNFLKIFKETINEEFVKQEEDTNSENPTDHEERPEQIASVTFFVSEDQTLMFEINVNELNEESINGLSDIVVNLLALNSQKKVIKLVEDTIKDDQKLLGLFNENISKSISKLLKVNNEENRKDTEDEPCISPLDALK
jgi:hypothetical protein